MRVAATQAFSFFGTVANLCRNVLSHLPSIIGLGFMSMRCGSGIATSLGSACFPAPFWLASCWARPIRPSPNDGGLRPAARADSARDYRRVIPPSVSLTTIQALPPELELHLPERRNSRTAPGRASVQHGIERQDAVPIRG